jgi:hypothetical protein
MSNVFRHCHFLLIKINILPSASNTRNHTLPVDNCRTDVCKIKHFCWVSIALQKLSKNVWFKGLYFVILTIMVSCSNIGCKWRYKASLKRALFAKSVWWITYLGFVVLQVLTKSLANPIIFTKVSSQIWRQ